jgi:hypothetical protein
MNKFPARTGLQWVKQGMQLFRKQPGGLMALFFCCMFLSMFIMVIPVGQLAAFVLTPLFTIALLEGVKHAEEGKRALPNLLLSGFRKPARGPLLTLGALNLAMLLVAAVVVYSMAGDVLARIAERPEKVDPALIESMMVPMFIASTMYTISWILTCLAAPLVYWKKLTVGKALFFSVVSVMRAIKPFLVATISLHLMYFVGCKIVALVFGSSQLAMAGIFTLFLLTIVLVHCTLYVAYQEIFAEPAVAPPVDLGKHDTPDIPS